MNLQRASPARAPRPLTIRLGKKLRPTINQMAARSSKVADAPLLDESALPWTRHVRSQWRRIRDEARAVLAHLDAIPPLNDISPDHARIANDNRWKSFFLHGYGQRSEENCRRAPATAALADGIPDLNSAFFSILAPGAHIPRHKGVTKGLLTWHLGLDVPSQPENCRMRLADELLHWRAGQSFLFDDTYPHEVWNDTGDVRVILLVQVRRPMRFPGSIGPDLFLWGIRRSAFVRDARARLADWEEVYRAAEQNERC